MREGPYTKLGAVAGVLSVVVAVIALLWTAQPSAPARSGAAPSLAATSTQPPLPGTTSSAWDRVTFTPTPVQASTAPTSIAGKWNGSDGNTYDFAPSGNGLGSYSGRIVNVSCGFTFLVTDQGGGLYSGTETIRYAIIFSWCNSGARINVTIQIAADGNTAVFNSTWNPHLRLVRSSSQS
jgi:hypothetical protein